MQRKGVSGAIIYKNRFNWQHLTTRRFYNAALAGKFSGFANIYTEKA
jgi:hypothetical protein